MDISLTGAKFSDDDNKKKVTSVLGDPLAVAQPSTATDDDVKAAIAGLSGGDDDVTTSATQTILPQPTMAPEPVDPAKTDFIKTYTEKFDDVVRRATDAADKVLDSIDTAIREHTNDIAIPSEAHEFLEDDAPESVEKFDAAREIVRKIMDKATAAKEESERAAQEASQIYDEVQEFKKQIRIKIDELRQD